MITDEIMITCLYMRRIAELETALDGTLPLLRDFACMTGFGETHAVIESAISVADTALNRTSGCDECEFYHECH